MTRVGKLTTKQHKTPNITVISNGEPKYNSHAIVVRLKLSHGHIFGPKSRVNLEIPYARRRSLHNAALVN